MRVFNIAGVCDPERHYMLPAEPRLPEVPRLVELGRYFVVHAPRQTGKTTTLAALARSLTAQGQYAVLHFSCEGGRGAGDDYGAAQRAVLDDIRSRAELSLPAELRPPPWPDASQESLLRTGLTAWAQACPRPLVLFFDEIDALRGPSLITVLSHLRAGAVDRPSGFPYSVGVCGLRDVRDYKVASGGSPSRMGGASPFNIITKSLRLGDFTADEVAELYGQHTAETGQEFTSEAVARAFDYTQGQPWLVNALAYQITEEMAVDLAAPITADHVDEAKERLIQARQTHLDSLADKLHDPRVRHVIEPLISGEMTVTDETYDDDVAYLRDLGLLAPRPPAAVANPIYREVIIRVLSASVEERVVAEPGRFVRDDGRLDFRKLLAEFARFWRQHSEVLIKGTVYHEVAPQLIMMGFLHRIVNGGGVIDREYGTGFRRVDLVVRWPYRDQENRLDWQWEAVELKVWHPGDGDPTEDGLQQLDEYLDRLELDCGTLIVFDRRHRQPPPADQVGFSSTQTPSGRPVTLLRL